MTVIAYMKNGDRKEWINIISLDEWDYFGSDYHMEVIKVVPVEGADSYIDKSKLERLVVKP